jgi:hypothetical protein
MSFLCHKTKIVSLAISLPKWSFRHRNDHFNNEMVIGSDGQTVLVHFVHSSKWSFWWKAQIEMTISMEDSFITTDPNCHWHMSCTPFNGLRIWNQSPNVEHFVRVIQINHDGTIDMLACHINQSIGSTSGFGKFTMSVLMDKDWVTHWIHVRNLAHIFREGCHSQWWLDIFGRWIANVPYNLSA